MRIPLLREEYWGGETPDLIGLPPFPVSNSKDGRRKLGYGNSIFCVLQSIDFA
jgi:hypothetical protein